MEDSFFPGYRKCVACQKPIKLENIRKHVLECRPKLGNKKKICTFCKKEIDEKEFGKHMSTCSEQQTISSMSISSNKKLCPICNSLVDDLTSHYHLCLKQNETKQTNDEISNKITNDKFQKISNQSSIDQTKSSIDDNSLKQMKICQICSKEYDQFEYPQHVSSCSKEISNETNHHLLNSSTKNKSDYHSNIPTYVSLSNLKNYKKMKKCSLCLILINESDYIEHVSNCSNENFDSQSEKRKDKICPFCSKEFDHFEFENHLTSCSNDQIKQSSMSNSIISSSAISKAKCKRKCCLCSQIIDEQQYEEHIQYCKTEQDSSNQITKKSKQTKSSKDCIICSKSIDQSIYEEHVSSCLSSQSSSLTTNSKNFKETKSMRKDCILCFKPIDLSDYETHVLACLAQSDIQNPNSSNRTHLNCLSCNRRINKEDDLYREMECVHRHIHCLSCLQKSMEEFARDRQTPLCHKRLCDYKLSRHDISLIPLERRVSDRLFKLAKGEQRPFCNKCHFYIDINDNNTFDDHYDSCCDQIPCEHCQFPYPFSELENHSKQCRDDKTSHYEKLANFVLPRTKYPFTKEQIRLFIHQQSINPRSNLDPLSIIEALAVFGETFPYDMPTRECDICLEARPYDDIYVFDCLESHKICYECYYQSCQTKMQNGEILTCALCSHPLKDGELNQLRISDNQLQKIRNYQMKKTFDVYSSRTRGIIKCPNQTCSWVAEAADPNERFKVNCPLCKNEFCSLCNQQYHYRTTCQQLPIITQQWFFWCQTERDRYLQMRAKQDATYKLKLNEYNKQTGENDKRNRELRQRYDELMNDEQYKAQNCRLCPSCKRVVQRLEGCDSMICGQDAHGGNLQSGCGATFNWAQAQPYNPPTTKQPKQKVLDLPKPENPVVYHEGLKCDQCQQDIYGIRFDCVHCPSLTFCEKCEQQATLDHSRQNQTQQQQQHVFRLIMKPQDEAF